MSAGEAAGQAQGGGEGEGGQAQQAPDVSALADQLGGLTQDMGQLRELLPQMQEFMQAQQQPQAEPAPEEQQLPPLDFGSGDPEYDAQIAQQLQQLIQHGSQAEIQKALQNELAPVREQMEQFKEFRTRQEFEALATDYPELMEPETAERVMTFNRQRAEAMGVPDHVAHSADYVKESYLLGRAMQAMQEEQQAAQQQPAHLEGAGGAGAGGANGVDLGDQIVNGPEGARLGSRVLPWH